MFDNSFLEDFASVNTAITHHVTYYNPAVQEQGQEMNMVTYLFCFPVISEN